MPIAWDGWPASVIDSALKGVNIVDLWVTSFYFNQVPYSQVLKSRLFYANILHYCNYLVLLANMYMIYVFREYRCLKSRFI